MLSGAVMGEKLVWRRSSDEPSSPGPIFAEAVVVFISNWGNLGLRREKWHRGSLTR